MRYGKVILAMTLLLGLVLVVMLVRKEQACFSLAEDNYAKICYEKSAYFNRQDKIVDKYKELVEQINSANGSLDQLVLFSAEMKSKYGASGLKKVRDYYGWIGNDNLIYVIEGDNFSVILLKKEDGNNHVLYFDMKNAKFYFDFDREKEYLPIDIGWVNKRYESDMEINTRYFWKHFNKHSCLFEKKNSILYTSMLSHDDDGNVICDFGFYRLIKTADINRVERTIPDVLPEHRNILDNTMIYIEYMAN